MRAAEYRRLPFSGEGRREVAVEAPLQGRTSDEKRICPPQPTKSFKARKSVMRKAASNELRQSGEERQIGTPIRIRCGEKETTAIEAKRSGVPRGREAQRLSCLIRQLNSPETAISNVPLHTACSQGRACGGSAAVGNHPRLHHPRLHRLLHHHHIYTRAARKTVPTLQSVKRYLAAGPRAAVFLGDRHRQGSAAILQARPKRFGAAPPFCVLVLGPRGKGKIVSAQAARPRPSKLLGDVVDGACRGCDAFEKRDNAPSHGRVG